MHTREWLILVTAALLGNGAAAQPHDAATSGPERPAGFGMLERDLADVVVDGRSRIESIRERISSDVDFNARGAQGRTLLMIAAGTGEPERVRAILDAGAAADARDDQGRTALFYSVAWHPSVAVGWTPSDAARWQAFETLIAAGADPNARANDGSTPLHIAALNDRLAAKAFVWGISLYKIDVDAADTRGRTPLMYAATSGDMMSTHERLREAQGGVGDDKALTIIAGIVVQGTDPVGMVRMLLLQGATVDASDADGATALMLAAGAGDAGAYSKRMLEPVENGLRLRTNDPWPVLRACSQHVQVVEILLAAGADPKRRNKKGDTAIDIAGKRLDRDRDRLVKTLKDAAKEPWPPKSDR